MKIKSFLAKPFATYIYKGIRKEMLTAVADQESILKQLIKTGRNTEYGREHGFANVNSYNEFSQAAPIHDYEQLRSYVEKIKEGIAAADRGDFATEEEMNRLWAKYEVK